MYPLLLQMQQLTREGLVRALAGLFQVVEDTGMRAPAKLLGDLPRCHALVAKPPQLLNLGAEGCFDVLPGAFPPSHQPAIVATLGAAVWGFVGYRDIIKFRNVPTLNLLDKGGEAVFCLSPWTEELG